MSDLHFALDHNVELESAGFARVHGLVRPLEDSDHVHGDSAQRAAGTAAVRRRTEMGSGKDHAATGRHRTGWSGGEDGCATETGSEGVCELREMEG